MTQPYRLHYAPDNASLAVRLALLELGQPFDTLLVDRRTGGQRSPAFLALNPNGQIPVLETPHGAMHETAAILLYLADRHGPGRLIPAPDDPARGTVLTWLFWLSNTLHPQLRAIFYPESHIGPGHETALTTRTRLRIADSLTMLDARLPSLAPWLGGPQASVLDCYLCPMLRWLALYPQGSTAWFALSRWPGLLAIARTMEARPSALAAATAEGLGPYPFSRPLLPTPPEGSAT
jgi:glutathione S-transferase